MPDDQAMQKTLSELIKNIANRPEYQGALLRYDSDVKKVEERLDYLYGVLCKKYKFRVGDRLKWKETMKNRKAPAYGEPVVVIDILPEPVYDSDADNKSAGHPLFREPLDIVLGIVDPDGELLMFHFDSRRFEPYTEQASKKKSSAKAKSKARK
ncbi:MAG: hypothetical protein L3K26_10900 [Candidatus Hydrogenedentes bacterium]|nr:hypothetical protein [Candidatus Hydrogenedentota bacterium]